MKTTKLTTAQIEKLGLLLAHQFMGKTIAKGNKYGYNHNQMYVGTPSRKHDLTLAFDGQEVSNQVFGKSVLNISVWDCVDMGWNQYYKPMTLNVSKLMKYTNGNEVMYKALYIVELQNLNAKLAEVQN